MKIFMQNAKELLRDLAKECVELGQKALQQTQHFVAQLKQRRGK
jgi:hypothetical protein